MLKHLLQSVYKETHSLFFMQLRIACKFFLQLRPVENKRKKQKGSV